MASFSSTTRITGLNSGLDVDGLVEQLMSAESSKYNSLQRKSQKVTWQQTAYRDVISKLQTFQNKWFGSSNSSTNFRFSSTFQNFQTKVMNADNTESSAVTVNSSKVDGEYKIEVSQLAQKDIFMSVPSTIQKDLSSTQTLTDAANTIKEGEDLSFNLNFDGTTKTITVTADELSSASGSNNGEKLKNLLNDKLKTSFGSYKDGGNTTQKVQIDENGDGTFKFSVNVDNGKGHTLTINEGSSRDKDKISVTTNNAFDIDKLTEGLGTGDKKEVGFTVNGTTVNVELEKGETNASFIKKINAALEEKDISVSASVTTETEKDADGKSVKTYKIKFTNTSSSDNVTIGGGDEPFRFDNANNELLRTGSLSDMGFKAGETTAVATNADTIGELINDDSMWDADGNCTININNTDVTINKDDNLSTVMTNVSSETGVKLSYNSVTKAFKLESDETGFSNTIEFGSGSEDFLSKLGFDFNEGSSTYSRTSVAQDAIVKIDDVETSRASNDINIDGLNITVNSVTSSEVTLTSTYDVTSMVDKIKSFVEEYNTLIGELNTTVKETRSKSGSYSYYEPLLDDEKKAMSEDEIEKWETEAKKGLLYNDSTIKGVMSSMRSTLYNQITTTDGKKISLFSIGITTTSDYTQGGKLVIDEEKLTAAVKNSGDAIEELFTQTKTGLGDAMNTVLNNAVGSTGTLRNKAGIVGTSSVSENTLSKQLKSISDQIDREKERLENKEIRYYELFSNMESAISKSNSQLDAVYSLFS